MPVSPASSLAREIYDTALEAVKPARLIEASCRRTENRLSIQDQDLDLDAFDRVFVCGAGKASCGLAKELAKLIGPQLSGGLVVTKHGHGLDLGKVRVVEASHPVLDESSILAGEAMAAFARQAQSSDLILFVLSGGASSLMEFLKPGISLADLQARTKQLLSNGADIREINRYRKSCSQIKGGGLGEMFDRAKVVCLVVSDVIGEDLSVIGSGPLYSEPNSIPHFILGNLDTAISAALRQAGLEARTDPTWIFEGEARDEAMQWVRSFLESTEPAIWIGGGEPVVTIRGPGKGGRCQEFATAAAKELEGTTGIALLAGSTDGSDGPTPFSGGIVNGNSVQLARERGVFIDDTLANNDSSKFLEACDGLIETGPTQSNVNDLYLLVRLGES